MLLYLYYALRMDSFSQAIHFINDSMEEDKRNRFGFGQVTVFLDTPEAEDEFVERLLASRRFSVVGMAENESLLEAFRKPGGNGCRSLPIKGSRGAERAAELAVRMLPTPYPSWEGDWDGMVVLRRPSPSTLAVVSACAWASEMLFLVSTIVDPSRHLFVVVLRPKGVLHEERGIAQHLVQTNMVRLAPNSLSSPPGD
ncbi:hypothetical protein EDD75_0367 [Thermodesulfitimonas autotrophica]|uniref:Uncharacterized protein n=1 Tax=Thermodesulfitimonas autotrophica TaxID=1894989 RepID=A0A3N5B1Q1_9THEO|nr:hypothetical protein [Thermodesulfitimonas autotrophica]RPF49550.1 hypothetical protein EDD75_0367 [Thermodesulfitimonas autotrophica]